jgi:hypothetical protein
MKYDRPSSLGDIDPAQVDAATAPTRKSRKRSVRPMPNLLESWAVEAKARMDRRPPPPGIMMERHGLDEFEPVSPHDNDEVWQLQIHDAFATRSPSVVRVFIEQLRQLCGQHWDDEDQGWRPSETELVAAVSFVNSIQPRSEPEAALAAQMLAVHLMTMRLSAQALNTGDTRTASVAGKLARTYAMQMDTLQRGRGKGRSTRQHITVKHEKHVHTHQHLHGDAWGCAPSPTPPATLIGDQHVRSDETRASVLGEGRAMPGEGENGAVVPIASRKRKARL